MNSESETSDTGDLLEEAPLTERTAERLERICGTHWAKSAAPAGREVISIEWRRLLPVLRARALAKSASVGMYRDVMAHAWDVTGELFQALHENAREEDPKPSRGPRGFWYHQQFNLFRAEDDTRAFAITRGDLAEVAARYLKHPEIQTNRLDWILLDSFTLAELEAFAQYAMTTRGGTGWNWAAGAAGHAQLRYYGYSILFWAFGIIVAYAVPIALIYYLAISGHRVGATVILVTWALWTLWKLATYPVRFHARRMEVKRLQHLMALYRPLGENTISPTNWRKSLDAATADGVVLDGAVFTIIDRAIGRDPTAFIPAHGAQRASCS